MRQFMRFPEGLSKAMTLSYDDGHEQDIRLVDIFNRYGLKCTFNLNTGLMPTEPDVSATGNRRITKKGVKELYGNGPHEVALHSSTHVWLETLPYPYAMKEILDDRRELEAIFQRPVRGMAYPFGTYGKDTSELLGQCGVVYARTVNSTKKFALPENWYEWHPTCRHLDAELIPLTEKFVSMNAAREPQLFYLWGHGFEFDRDNNWKLIEKFGRLAGHRDDIWYATNIEIYEYVKAYERLIWSVDQKMIYNPSAFPVWISIGEYGEKMFTVKLEGGQLTKI